MASAVSLRDLPPPESPFVEKGNLNLSYDGYQFLLSLLNALFSALSQATVSTALTATGTNQATALQLTSQWNQFSSVPSGTGALLSALQAGQSQLVFNQGSNSINIFPPPGVSIDALAANAPYALGPAKTQYFNTISASQILTSQVQVP